MNKICLFILLFVTSAHGEVIRFPDDELAKESVLPVFDRPVSVRNRLVELKGRVELGAGGAYDMTQAFFLAYGLGATASYHFNEEQGLNFFGNYWVQGASDYSKQLNPPPRSTQNMNLQLAPAPKWLFLANYQHTGFYGKMSFSKETVMNLSLYGLAGIGAFGIGDAVKPTVSVGLGQKFYFTPNIALRFDLRLLLYRGPNILDANLANATTNVSDSEFPQKFMTTTLLNGSLVFLLPNT